MTASTEADAVEPVESFDLLVTGNGFGFQVFDSDANQVVQFLERPYRFLKPNPANPDGDGIVRRNLLFDAYFGVRVGSNGVWLGKQNASDVGYVDQTNVIRSVVTVDGVRTESYFLSPYGYDGNALIMLIKVTNESGSAKTVDTYSLANFHMGSAPVPDRPQANGESLQLSDGVVTETGPGGGVMVYAPIGGSDASSCATNVFGQVEAGNNLTGPSSCSGDDRVQVFQKSLGSLAAGESAWWGVGYLFDYKGDSSAAKALFEGFVGSDDAEAVLARVLGDWNAWRKPVPPGLSSTEVRIWRQSEVVLRMGQTLEPYSESPKVKNHGMVLASLPPGGWHSGWVRDAVYGIVAMARSGHFQEAKWALNFFLNAEAGKYKSFLNNVDYRITTVRYFGNGEEEADYSGAPTRNIEIDGWGLFLWAARTYVDASGDTAWLSEKTEYGETIYDVLRENVAEALVANMEPNGMAIADASIWEVHWGNRQHFLYTTASAARGFCDMAALSKRFGSDGDRDRYKGFSERAVVAMETHFVDQSKVLAGSLERLASGSYRDGAVVEAFVWNLIKPDNPIMAATMNDFSFLQTPAGGYKRVEGSADQYDTDEWILIDLRASDAWRRLGNHAKADELLNWVTSQANVNFDLIPELYNTRSQSGAIGAYSGSIPMVGYGAGAYMLTLLHRQNILEPDDCGTVESYPDGGVGDYVDGGLRPESDGGPGAGIDGRTGFACVCHQGASDPAGLGGLGVLLMIVIAGLRRRSQGRS